MSYLDQFISSPAEFVFSGKEHNILTRRLSLQPMVTFSIKEGDKPEEETDTALLYGASEGAGPTTMAALDTAKEPSARKSTRSKHGKGKSSRAKRRLFKRLRVKRKWAPAAFSTDVGGQWITIGGQPDSSTGEKHVGGFRVFIDPNGKILKGRLKGKNVKNVKSYFDKKKKAKAGASTATPPPNLPAPKPPPVPTPPPITPNVSSVTTNKSTTIQVGDTVEVNINHSKHGGKTGKIISEKKGLYTIDFGGGVTGKAGGYDLKLLGGTPNTVNKPDVASSASSRVHPGVTLDQLNKLSEITAPTSDHITSEQIRAIKQYTDEGYKKWNKILRSGPKAVASTDPDTAKRIKDLQEAINSAPPLSNPVNCYRGLAAHKSVDKLLNQFNNALNSGGEVTMNGFSSTSLNPMLAIGDFAGGSRGGIVLEISARKGLSLEKHTTANLSNEREFLLNHGARFRVISIEDVTYGKRPNIKTVKLEQLS